MSPEVTKYLVNILQLIVVAAVGWSLRMQLQTQSDVRDIKTTLIGIDGKNGVRGDVTELKGATEEQWKHIAKHDTDIALLKQRAGTVVS